MSLKVIPEAALIDPWLERGEFLVRLIGDRKLGNTRAMFKRFGETHQPPLRVTVTRHDAHHARVVARAA